MTSKNLLCLSLLLFQSLEAESVEDYFHRAVTNYIYGKFDEAKAAVTAGIEKFPNEPKLSQLRALLQKENKQEQKPKSGQNAQQDSPQSNQPGKGNSKQLGLESSATEEKARGTGPKKQQGEEARQPTPQPNVSGPEPRPEKQDGQAGEKPAAANAPAKADTSGNETGAGAASAVVPGQMTPEQARQLLEAARLDEKAWQPLPPRDPRRLNRPRRDW